MISLKRALCQRCDIMKSIGSLVLLVLTVCSAVVSNQNVTYVTYARSANVTLVCPATVSYLFGQWYYTPVKCTGRNGTFIQLPTNHADSKYRKANLPNGPSLSINQIDLGDAGIYKCTIEISNKTDESPEFIFHVTVIASKPECHVGNNIVQENNTMKLQCSITYCSLTEPTIDWSQSGPYNERIANIDNSSTNINQLTIGTTMTSFLTVIGTDHLKSWTYSCRANFNQSRSEDNKFSKENEFYNGICETVALHMLYSEVNDRMRMVTIIGGTASVATLMVVILIVVILVYTKRRRRHEKLSHTDDYSAGAASSHSIQPRGAQSDPIYSCIRDTDELEYMEVNVSHETCSPTGSPSVQQQLFSTSVYAGIDHTLQLPR